MEARTEVLQKRSNSRERSVPDIGESCQSGNEASRDARKLARSIWSLPWV